MAADMLLMLSKTVLQAVTCLKAYLTLNFINQANFYKMFFRNLECLVSISLGVEHHQLVR